MSQGVFSEYFLSIILTTKLKFDLLQILQVLLWAYIPLTEINCRETHKVARGSEKFAKLFSNFW